MTVIQKKSESPIAHLTAEDIEELSRELDAIREQVVSSRGERDAAYIRKVIDVQRKLEIGSRAVLLFSLFPPAWLLGTAGLSIAKILDNMEIGHNDLHHQYTNVVGRDNDLGYGIMRVDEDQPWHPAYLGQPLYNLLNAFVFEYGIAAYDIDLAGFLDGKVDKSEFLPKAKKVLAKIRKQVAKDYVVHPLLSGPSVLHTLAANVTANVVRNLWSHAVIICGHFPSGVETFAKTSIEGETRGEWYLRQMLGSANISGSKAMHLMSGNLSYQIEHHLFPDLPSNRYAEIAPQVRELFERYGLNYVTGPLPKQVASAWAKVFRLSLPNDFFGKRSRAAVNPARSRRRERITAA